MARKRQARTGTEEQARSAPVGTCAERHDEARISRRVLEWTGLARMVRQEGMGGVGTGR